MQSKKFRLQLLLIGGAIVLIVLLYLAPREEKVKQQEVVPTEHSHPEFNFEEELEAAKGRIGEDNRAIIEDLEQRIDEDGDGRMFGRLASEWEMNEQPVVAAYYYQRAGEKTGDAVHFARAGDLYYSAYRSAVDSVYAHHMSNLAIASYEKALEKGTADNQVKTNLAVLIVENTANPMRGITLLQEVVKEDPENESAQLQLGFFSYKSGQYDKAIERFENVLEINPQRTDAHLYIGEAYLASGQKDKAIERFERFLQISDNPALKREVEGYINQIKNSNN